MHCVAIGAAQLLGFLKQLAGNAKCAQVERDLILHAKWGFPELQSCTQDGNSRQCNPARKMRIPANAILHARWEFTEMQSCESDTRNANSSHAISHEFAKALREMQILAMQTRMNLRKRYAKCKFLPCRLA